MAATVGIREFKNRLSQYVRRVEAGETVLVTAHGRAVAQLGPPPGATTHIRSRGLDALIEAGLARPPLESGSPVEGWTPLDFPPGTAAAWVDGDRDER